MIPLARLGSMHARALTIIAITAWLALGSAAAGQDEPEEQPSEQAPSDRGKTRPRTGAGRLPVEDPTIHVERNEDLEAQAQERQAEKDPAERGAAGKEKVGPKKGSEAAKPDDAAPEETEDPDALDGEHAATALPVEDPTIEGAPEPVDDDSAEEQAEAVDKVEEEEDDDDSKDWGQHAQVAYAYEGGLLVGVDDWFYLALSGLVQARYAVNYRTKPPTDPVTLEREKQVTQGFDVARARFHLGIGLTQFVALYMRIGVVAGGEFSFQRAFIDLKWKYFRVRAGLFMNETIAESLINPNDLLFNDYTTVENVFTPGSSKGVMFTYLRRRFSINLGYSDGLRTGFSEIRSAARADFAVTLRTQYAWGERGLGGFNRLIARRGTPFGVRLGAAVHYQDGGRSQGTTDLKIALGTIDVSLRGNGWSILLSGTSGQDGRIDTTGAVPNDSFEVVSTGGTAMGGYFVLDDLQVFAQYSIVSKPRIQGEPPPTIPGLPEAEASSFQTFGVGLTYFVIPGHDNVKLSTDFQYFLGREMGSSVPASPVNNIQPNDDGSQFFWRIQLSAAF